MSGSDLIALRNVTVAYRRRPALQELNGAFQRGSLTAVVGPNGAGKSTLIRCIAGLIRPAAGRVDLLGPTQGDIAYLPQLEAIDDSFPISVRDVMALGFWRRVGAFGSIGRALRDEVGQALRTVDLEGFGPRPFASLSAGQRQRVLFGRVLLADSPIILLDEPFSAVDARTTTDLLRLVLRWHAEGRTVICVTHDFDQARAHFPEALLLARRIVAWGDTAKVLSADNLRSARALSEGWDADHPVQRGAA